MSFIKLPPINIENALDEAAINPAIFSHIDEVKSQIDLHGYCITANAIDIAAIDRMKNFWSGFIIKKNINRKFVRGNLVLGENNFLSYSDIPSWCMYRNFDFYWNKPTHCLTSEICLKLNSLRNSLQGFESGFGTQFNQDNYGIYVSTSLYSVGKGHFAMHADAHGKTPILHFMIPLTFKGEDYNEGGLFIENKSGDAVDIDSQCDKGALIFFDGRCSHGVKTIQGKGIGRLAVFAIPTYFETGSRLEVFARSFKVFIEEYIDKFSFLKAVRSFLGRIKRFLRKY